jgi:hypothetical protein
MDEANDGNEIHGDFTTMDAIEEEAIDEAIASVLNKKVSVSLDTDDTDSGDSTDTDQNNNKNNNKDDNNDNNIAGLFVDPLPKKPTTKKKNTKAKAKKAVNGSTTGKSPWLSIEKKSTDKDGKTVYSFPFVEQRNEKDERFISLLNFHLPFTVDHGGKKVIWEKLYNNFCLETTDEGKPLFETGVPCVRSLKKRVDEYKDFVKKHKNLMNLLSGCDNISNTDLLKDVYDLVQLIHEAEEKKRQLKDKKLLKDQQNRDAAKEHRDASVGLLKKRTKNTTSDNQLASDLSEEDSNSKSTRATKKRQQMYPSLNETMEKREARLQMKEDNRKQSLGLKERSLSIRERELDIRKMEAENQQKNCENTRLLLENTHSMVSAMMNHFMEHKNDK